MYESFQGSRRKSQGVVENNLHPASEIASQNRSAVKNYLKRQENAKDGPMCKNGAPRHLPAKDARGGGVVFGLWRLHRVNV